MIVASVLAAAGMVTASLLVWGEARSLERLLANLVPTDFGLIFDPNADEAAVDDSNLGT